MAIIISNLKLWLLFRCYLCGKETPSGSGNVLLHLRHHRPEEHTKIVDQVARAQLQRATGLGGQPEAEVGGSVRKPAASVGSDPEESLAVFESSPEVSVKNETPHIKIEINNDDDESF